MIVSLLCIDMAGYHLLLISFHDCCLVVAVVHGNSALLGKFEQLRVKKNLLLFFAAINGIAGAGPVSSSTNTKTRIQTSLTGLVFKYSRYSDSVPSSIGPAPEGRPNTGLRSDPPTRCRDHDAAMSEPDSDSGPGAPPLAAAPAWPHPFNVAPARQAPSAFQVEDGGVVLFVGHLGNKYDGHPRIPGAPLSPKFFL